MEYVTLNTGAKMPLEGFGVFQIPDADECERVVYDAIKTGYRLLDTAASYMNEEALGKGVKKAIADGLVTREELFITTKVWVQDQKTEKAAYEAVKASLEKLDMPYVDLVLLHQAMGDYFAAYRGITKAYQEGLTKAVGVSNFFPSVLANICENVEVIPAVNQVELHPFFAQQEALATMKAYGIAPQAWAPLAEGKHGIFTDPELTEIGAKYGKSAAQVVLRWNVQRGVSILPKSTHVERMEQNLSIWDFELIEDEMKKIGEKDLGHSEIINHFDPQLVKMLNNRKIHEEKENSIPAGLSAFPVGEPNTSTAQYFIGQSYLAPVSTSQVPIFNVTFEPGCRNNWHIHHAKNGGGQMLICVSGRGWYQEWGKEARELHPGDVVNIPAEVKHWHGAAKDTWFQHLAVEVQGEETKTEWCEAVTADAYDKLD